MFNNRNIILSIYCTLGMIFHSIAYGGPLIEIKNVKMQAFDSQITVEVSVDKLKGTQLADINDENLFVYEDGLLIENVKVQRVQNIDDFIYFVFSIDSSKSISEKLLHAFKKTAVKIINCALPQDKMALFSFDDEVNGLQFFSTDKKELINQINKIQRSGSKTKLYSALYSSIEILKNARKDGRIIVAFTDGKDEGSSITIEDVIKYARESEIPIYFFTSKGSGNIKEMSRISLLTEGSIFYTHSLSSPEKIYKLISSSHDKKFLLKYSSAMGNDDQIHTIEIQLKQNDIRDSDSIKIISHNIFYSYLLKEPMKIGIAFFAIIGLIFLVILLSKKRMSMSQYAEDILNRDLPIINTIKSSRFSDQMDDDYIPSQHKKFEEKYEQTWLIEKKGPEIGKKFFIFKDNVTIGRGYDNHIRIDDESISETHAKIKNNNGEYTIFDLVSDTGIYLNKKKLLRPKILHDWDEMQLGSVILIFRGTNSETQK